MHTHNKNQQLVVAYKGFDVYDLPDELNDIGINSVDLGENGAVPELIRNVIKILGPKDSLHHNIDTLYERIIIDIACDDFNEANRIADTILEQDSGYSRAYIAKVQCALKVKKESELARMDRSKWTNETKANWAKGAAFIEENEAKGLGIKDTREEASRLAKLLKRR